MILAWTLYLIWAVLIPVTYWQIVQVNDISRAQLYIPITGTLCFVVFSYVFVFNRGSGVVQLAQDKDLWGFWAGIWLPLLILSLVSFFGSAAYFVMMLVKAKGSQILVSSALLAQSAFCLYHVLWNQPSV